MSPTPETVAGLWPYSGKARVGVAAVAGLAGWAVDRTFGPKGTSLLVGWDAAALLYVLWLIFTTFSLDEGNSAGLASSKGPDRRTIDLVMLSASIASLAGVGILLVQAGDAKGSEKDVLVAIGVFSVVCSWLLVHTVYALRYARLFYDECQGGGIDFNDEDQPSYADFAYLAFTVGMTFQVSDTDIKDKRIRRTILHQALLSYVFGTVIVATTINFIAGLGGK